ncbi:flavodoxin domain-containing protein [Bacillus licheniformis]|nr:flavodoxin domain-containing protein [Bacillus licheniformis]
MKSLSIIEVILLSKALIAYASMSGNTEDIAMIIKDTLREYGLMSPFRKWMMSIPTHWLNMIFFNRHLHMGDGDLPYEAESFYEEVSSLDLKGKKAACFGSGDYAYPDLRSGQHVYTMLERTGADLYQETLK